MYHDRGDLTISAVDLICKPGKLRTVMDQISTVFIRLRYFPAASVPGIGYSRRPDFRLQIRSKAEIVRSTRDWKIIFI